MLVYAFDSKAGHKYERARGLVVAGRSAGAFVTIQALCEVYSVLTRKQRRSAAEARAAIVRVSDNLHVVEPALDMVRATTLSERHDVSFWDAFMICVAARGGCTSLVTEDLQDGRRFSATDAGRSIRVIDPFADANLELLRSEGL